MDEGRCSVLRYVLMPIFVDQAPRCLTFMSVFYNLHQCPRLLVTGYSTMNRDLMEMYQRLQLQFYVLLMMGAMDTRNM